MLQLIFSAFQAEILLQSGCAIIGFAITCMSQIRCGDLLNFSGALFQKFPLSSKPVVANAGNGLNLLHKS
jgi:hypothetical protein